MPTSKKAVSLVVITFLVVILICSSVAKFNAFGQYPEIKYDSYEHCTYTGQYPPVDDLSWSSNCCGYKNTDKSIFGTVTPPVMVCQICKGVGFQKQCLPPHQRVYATLRPAEPQQPSPNPSSAPPTALFNTSPGASQFNAPITTTGGNTSNPGNNNTAGGSSTAMRLNVYSPTGYCFKFNRYSCMPCDPGIPGGKDMCTPTTDWPAPSPIPLAGGGGLLNKVPQPPTFNAPITTGGNTSTPNNGTTTAMKATRGVYSPTGGCDRSRTDRCMPCDLGSPDCIPSSDWPAGPYCIPGIVSQHCIPTTPSKNKIGAIGPPANILSSQSGNTTTPSLAGNLNGNPISNQFSSSNTTTGNTATNLTLQATPPTTTSGNNASNSATTGNAQQQQLQSTQQQQQSTAATCPDGSAPDANGNCPNTSSTSNQQLAPPSSAGLLNKAPTGHTERCFAIVKGGGPVCNPSGTTTTTNQQATPTPTTIQHHHKGSNLLGGQESTSTTTTKGRSSSNNNGNSGP